MALNRQEANEFLERVLMIPSTLSDAVPDRDKDRVAFLDMIIKTFQERIPYQTVSICATPMRERHLPTWPEIKRDMFLGIGGICYTLHVFMKELLSALEFNVCYVGAGGATTDDHIGIVAFDVSYSGSKHLVEVACGYPTFRAIPLDFEAESPEYRSGFLRHKFVWRNDKILWFHEYKPHSDPMLITNTSNIFGGWYRFLELKVTTPRELSSFAETTTSFYTEPNTFFESPRIVIFEGCQLLALVGNTKYTAGTDKGPIIKTPIGGIDEIIAFYSKYFPQMRRSEIDEAARLSSSALS